MSSTYQMSILQWQYWLLTKLLKPFLLTFDLWLNFDSLNFDSSIWIMTPGPPSLGIGCKIRACQATSLHFRAILMRTLHDAIPSKNMALKKSFWAHFQETEHAAVLRACYLQKTIRSGVISLVHIGCISCQSNQTCCHKTPRFIFFMARNKYLANYLLFTGFLPTTDIHQVSVGK